MIQLTPNMRVLVAKEPLDFRTGIDGTAAACRRVLAESPMTGTVFVFRNRAGTMVRLLVYDGQGFWLATKRMSRGRFRFWKGFAAGDASKRVAAHQLHVLLVGGDWTRTPRAAPQWRKTDAADAAVGCYEYGSQPS
jgi:transposase